MSRVTSSVISEGHNIKVVSSTQRHYSCVCLFPRVQLYLLICLPLPRRQVRGRSTLELFGVEITAIVACL